MSGEITKPSEEMVIQVPDKVKVEIDKIMGGNLENMSPKDIPGVVVLVLIILKQLGICHYWDCDNPVVGPSDEDSLTPITCPSGWKLKFKPCD